MTRPGFQTLERGSGTNQMGCFRQVLPLDTLRDKSRLNEFNELIVFINEMFQTLGGSIQEEFTKIIRKYLLTTNLFPEVLATK